VIGADEETLSGGVCATAEVLRAGFIQSATGIGVARWSSDAADELVADRFDARVICVQLRRVEATIWDNGRLSSDGWHEPGCWQVHAPGESFRSVVRSEYDLLRLVLPDETMTTFAHASDLDTRATAIEFRRGGKAPDPLLLALAKEVGAVLSGADPLSRLYLDSLAQAFVLRLLTRHSNQTPKLSLVQSSRKGGLAPWQVKRVGEYLEANLASDISLSELAGIAHLSPGHFCRAYKESTGKTPIQALIATRVERAEALLADQDMPVIEVAAAVGYEQPGKFARVFRRATGLTPSEWRRSR
jgi:AraC family transcriptional regulator